MAVQNEIVDTRRINPENVSEVVNPVISEVQYETFVPILDRVQVKVLDEMVKDESGVMVPPKYRQHSNKGIVVKVGQWVVLGGKQIPLDTVLKPGDKVLFGEYNCEKFVEGGEEYELVRVQDIRGVERLIDGYSEDEKNI
jgi:chaperonin GroES